MNVPRLDLHQHVVIPRLREIRDKQLRQAVPRSLIADQEVRPFSYDAVDTVISGAENKLTDARKRAPSK